MILCYLSIRNVAAVIYAILLQLTLALALPTGDYHQASRIETRSSSSVQTLHLQSKREPETSVDSSSVPKIAGGVFGIVALGLIFGLGSASIAVFGSLEWQKRRDKKKKEKAGAQADEEKRLDDSSSENTTVR